MNTQQMKDIKSVYQKYDHGDQKLSKLYDRKIQELLEEHFKIKTINMFDKDELKDLIDHIINIIKFINLEIAETGTIYQKKYNNIISNVKIKNLTLLKRGITASDYKYTEPELIKCECGIEYLRIKKNRHEASAAHKRWLKTGSTKVSNNIECNLCFTVVNRYKLKRHQDTPKCLNNRN